MTPPADAEEAAARLAEAARAAGLPPATVAALAERHRLTLAVEPCTLAEARARLDALRRGCRQVRRWARPPAVVAALGGVHAEWLEVAAEVVAALGRLDALAAEARARVEHRAAAFRRGGRRDLAELLLGGTAKARLAREAAAALDAARPAARGDAARLHRLVAAVHAVATGDDRETGIAHAVRTARRKPASTPKRTSRSRVARAAAAPHVPGCPPT